MDTNLIVTTPEQLTLLIEISVNKAFQKNFIDKSINLLTRNEVRLKLGIGYKKLNDLIQSGKLKTTPDKKYITEVELNKYLGNE